MTGRTSDSAADPAIPPVSPSVLRALRALLLGPAASLPHQFARYTLVGGLAFVVDFGSLFLLTEFAGLHYLISAAIAFLLGLIANYLLSRAWVFDRRTLDSAPLEFAVFSMIGVVGLGLNEVIIWFVREKVHFHYLAAKAISAVIVLIWNFGARRATLFSANPAAAGMTNRMARMVRAWLSPACVGAAYFLFCLLVQASSGAWQAGFVAHPDEPSHFVGAVMVRDWLHSGQWLSPFQFARDYYSHYPFFAIGYWPPAFSVVTGFVLLLAGVGRMQALLVPAASAAATAWMLFFLLRRRTGAVAAVCAGALYLSLPPVQKLMCAVMVDHLTVCLCIATGVWLVQYLRQPGWANGILLAVTCACAILSKYSAVYLVALPWAAILLFRRVALLRKPSFLIQPVIIALMVGPWALWTKSLATYGLPAVQPALTAARAGSFVTTVFAMFLPVLTVVVILGFLALLALPRAWGEDVGVLALLAAGRLLFLTLSPVGVEERYLLVPVACLLVLSFAGWAEVLARIPHSRRLANAVSVAVAVLTVAFGLIYFCNYSRPPRYPIRSLVQTVLDNRSWAGRRIVVPADLEGPFIAEFVARESPRPRSYLLRPSKILARSDWFGGRYQYLFRSPEEMQEFFRQNPVTIVLWHARTAGLPPAHERVLGDMLRQNPLRWRQVGSFNSSLDLTPSWAIYEQE